MRLTGIWRHKYDVLAEDGRAVLVLDRDDMMRLGFKEEELDRDVPMTLGLDWDDNGSIEVSYKAGWNNFILSKDGGYRFILTLEEAEEVGIGILDDGKRLNLSVTREGRVDRICCHDVVWNYPDVSLTELRDADEAAIMESIVAGIPKGELRMRDDKGWHIGSWYIDGYKEE